MADKMTRAEAYEFYGEGGTYDHLDEIEDEERGLTLREVRAERQLEAQRLREVRGRVYKDQRDAGLVPMGDT